MFKLALISALFALAAATAEIRSERPQLDGRIMGGFGVTIEWHPYQISLLFRGYHICSGSIIARDLILTAAHCTSKYQAGDISIRYGSSIKNQAGTVLDVLSKKEHHLYDPNTMDYDISFLVLRGRVELSASAQVVPLPYAGAPEGDRDALVTGWGKLSSCGVSPTQLQAIWVSEVDRQECNRDYYGGVITDRMMCFMEPYKETCQGDSGSPLVCRGQLIGIVSWGWGCAKLRYPGIYSNVALLQEFIPIELFDIYSMY